MHTIKHIRFLCHDPTFETHEQKVRCDNSNLWKFLSCIMILLVNQKKQDSFANSDWNSKFKKELSGSVYIHDICCSDTKLMVITQ